MMRVWPLLLVGVVGLSGAAWSRPLEPIQLKDGTTLFARVVEVSDESVHLVSTRLNRKIPAHQIKAPTWEMLQSRYLTIPSEPGDEATDRLRQSLADFRQTRSYRFRVHPVTIYPFYYTAPYVATRPCYGTFSRPTWSIHIDL